MFELRSLEAFYRLSVQDTTDKTHSDGDEHNPMTHKTLILGLGNTLMTDEAVGPVVVRRLKAEADPGAPLLFLDGGTLSFTLAGWIEECPRLIVVDAAAMGETPGTVQIFEGEAMDRQVSLPARSVHEVSLADLIDMVRLTGHLPERRALVGIEPAVIDWGDGLTPALKAAVPLATYRVRELLDHWDDKSGSP